MVISLSGRTHPPSQALTLKKSASSRVDLQRPPNALQNVVFSRLVDCALRAAISLRYLPSSLSPKRSKNANNPAGGRAFSVAYLTGVPYSGNWYV